MAGYDPFAPYAQNLANTYGQQPYGQQPYGQQPYGQPRSNLGQQQTRGLELSYVNGVEGARTFPLPPNSAVALFDNLEDVVHIKTTDAGGTPAIQSFGLVPIESQDQGEYITRKEFNTQMEQLKELMTNDKQVIQAVPATPSATETAPGV